MRESDLKKDYADFTTENPFDFALRSSIGCGGVARLAFCPRSKGELISLLERLHADGVGYRVLGNLTNVLPPDGESKRAVVRLKHLQVVKEEQNGLYVSAGATSGLLLRVCAAANLSGAEFLAGIPCTVGGALFMNAGVSGRYIAEIVQSVRVLYQNKQQELSLADCKYAYKTSVFMQDEFLILGASLRLTPATAGAVEREIKGYLQKRAHLPKGRSMGCVFKNPQPPEYPENISAGKLIEGAGLKGMRVGGAFVSDTHANFIINDKNATSEQIKRLIDIIKNAVYAQYKIRLEEEIRYLD